MTSARWVTKVPKAARKRGDGQEVRAFIEAFGRSTKDTIAAPVGELIVLRSWQQTLLDELYARRPDARRKHRVALVGMPRKNGKSAIGSGMALHGLYMGPAGAEVYSCAADREQARIVFGVAKRMVELDPELSAEAKLYRDAIEIPSRGSVYRVLSSEAFTKEGLNPSLVVYDELHAAPNDELWNVMNLGSGTRVDPLVVAITTAGKMFDSSGHDSVCYRLFQHGKRVAAGEVDDPSFYFCWWAAGDEADHQSPKTWDAANPAYADLIDPEDFESAVRRTPEVEFRIKRCNQWTTSSEAWLPHGAWKALKANDPDEMTDVVLGFDGSYKRDSTALYGFALGDKPHGFLIGAWEKPDNAGDDWRVPRGEVQKALHEAFQKFRVRRLLCDPYRWETEIDEWADTYGDVVLEFPTNSRARMTKACGRFYSAVVQKDFTQDGHPTVARHLSNAVLKQTPEGPYITKDAADSPRKIDAAVAAVIAWEAAAAYQDGRTDLKPVMVVT